MGVHPLPHGSALTEEHKTKGKPGSAEQPRRGGRMGLQKGCPFFRGALLLQLGSPSSAFQQQGSSDRSRKFYLQ